MNRVRLFLTTAMLGLPGAALAQDEAVFPEIDYGLWETTTVSSMKSEAMNLPETSNTSSACVTAEDVEKGRAFLKEQDECDILEQTMTKTSVDMTMVCNQPQVGEMKMDVSMQYD
ncbi:MAG: DUF3617 family protein [Pseudomonadota bacterium]